MTRLDRDWQHARSGEAVRMWTRIPAAPADAQLVFRSYADAFTIDVDARRVYTFADAESRGRLTLHVVPLPPGSAGKRLEVFVPHARQSTLFGDSFVIASANTLPFAINAVATGPLRDNVTDVVLGAIFIAVGIVALIAAALRRRGDVLALAGMGAFTLLYGVRLVAESYVPLLLGGSLQIGQYVSAWVTYIIPIPGWFVARRLIGAGWHSSLRLQVFVFALYAPIAIAIDLITRTAGSVEHINNVLVIAGGLNILFNLLLTRRAATQELRVVLAGSLVFMLFAVGNNLSALGLLPWRTDVEAIGFVAFVASLGYAATRAFTRGERDRLSIEHELRTAREIQQSILPRSMPDVQGLAFDTGYDPATSVAGDVYEFQRVDDKHVAVLVADVAGHGVPAALIAAMVKIAASSQTRLADDPAALLDALNTTLRTEVRGALVTATYLWFDMEQRRVSVSNAGHAPPLLYRNGAFFDELGAHGVFMGRFVGPRYETETTELEPGDRIVAFTDGIVEARNARDEQFGEERLQELIARATAAEVIAAVHQWRVTDDADDLTIVVVDVTR
ncbi:MAG TPA: PP2C family protein-serine/threonine phosphatase [Thermoanaerobaculia bacterium]|nr:PP2C family protein-serine/threonine phosphatase [Thermoanaerobaculia bacterium]